MPERLTLFEDLEGDKENYTVQRQGRSASLISHLQNTSEETRLAQRDEYWREILDKAQSVEDPLKLFTKYIEFESHHVKGDWNSRRSRLLEVNELCLLYCEKMDRYKNNLQFLNVWLDYCTNFHSNEEQIDILVYMYRSKIANQLADFYSYFIDVLVLLERYQEAYQVVQLGIKAGAQPERQLEDELQLLKRDYSQDIEVVRTSDVWQTSLKEMVIRYNEPSLVLNQDRNSLLREYQGRPQGNTSNSTSGSNNNMEIYSDTKHEGDTNQLDNSLILKLTESKLMFQSKNERLKENISFISGKIGPDTVVTPLYSVNAHEPSDKLPIFNDEFGRNGPIYKIVSIDGKKPEKIDCNFNLIYREDGIEFSIEELLAQSRFIKKRNLNETNIPPVVKRLKS